MASHLARLVVASTLAAALTGCGTSQQPAETPPVPSPVVNRYASPNPGSVNAYLVSTPQGNVLVDSGRNTTGGRLLVHRVRATGRPLLAILVTHEHPDHIGGLPALHEAFPDAPIYASQQTVDLMRRSGRLYQAARRDDPDFPPDLVYPDHPLGTGDPTTLELGGTVFEARQFGVGESGAATVYYLPSIRELFTGDLTVDRMTPALIQGATCGWLDDIEDLHSFFPEAATTNPGHGAPGAASDQERVTRTYLERVRALVVPAVAPSSPGGTQISRAEQRAVLATLDQEYPGYPRVAALPTLAEANVAAVAEELRAETPGTRCGHS